MLAFGQPGKQRTELRAGDAVEHLLVGVGETGSSTSSLNLAISRPPNGASSTATSSYRLLGNAFARISSSARSRSMPTRAPPR